MKWRGARVKVRHVKKQRVNRLASMHNKRMHQKHWLQSVAFVLGAAAAALEAAAETVPKHSQTNTQRVRHHCVHTAMSHQPTVQCALLLRSLTLVVRFCWPC